MTDVVSQIQYTLDRLRRDYHRQARIGEIQLSTGDWLALQGRGSLGARNTGIHTLTYVHTDDVLPVKENPAVQDGEVWVTVSFR